MRTIFSLRTASPKLGLALLTLTGVYILLAVLPFYGYGIHLRSIQEIGASLVDPKGCFPFDMPLFGGPAQALAIYGAHLTPVASLVLAPVFVLSLGLNWSQFRRAYRLFWASTVAVNATTLLLTWQSLGVMRFWLAD